MEVRIARGIYGVVETCFLRIGGVKYQVHIVREGPGGCAKEGPGGWAKEGPGGWAKEGPGGWAKERPGG